jgi:predicted DNA-binding transcriptional regulator AlpA
MQKQLLRLPDVRRIVGLSRSEIYRRMALKPPQFPLSVPLGERVRAWDSQEIAQFVEKRIAARDEATA